MHLPVPTPVAVFMTAFEPGGTERQMSELIRRLDAQRFRVHVACFHKRGAWLPRVLERAASVVEFPIHGFARAATAAQMLSFARWCRRERIAVVQTCDMYSNIFGLPGAALARVPVRIGSRRELNPDKSPGQIRLQRLAYRTATKVVANSPAARQMLEAEGLATGSIAVIPNGVDPIFFGSPERTGPVRTVITVANLRPEKSHETLLAAAASLISSHPSLRFQIVGDGPRRHELERIAATLGLSAHVEFLGHREDVPALLAAADAFVLPSRTEAFPNSAIEAMAAGIPVVACAVGGLLDLIQNGRTGLLVPPDDSAALAAALLALADDPRRAHAIGAAGRRLVQQRYSFDRMVGSFDDLYCSGLHGSLPARTHEAEAAGI
ncbi:MAG TPA: glycosyltransferase [Vicinamibacterales bacterium]|nr:glycosyltransferase [Vicinamibacterales bacterium]